MSAMARRVQNFKVPMELLGLIRIRDKNGNFDYASARIRRNDGTLNAGGKVYTYEAGTGNTR